MNKEKISAAEATKIIILYSLIKTKLGIDPNSNKVVLKSKIGHKLKRLKMLKQKGLISKDNYNYKKKELIEILDT